ncbi:hypothetical protein AWH51_09390 [Clavibacter tessellarius]|uniref:Uncharacterized protein n=1 Tax=Clavibacter tessellarius TaxID=31965 RepID=A0A154V1E8_9MICO|nr:hypothetical protein AWH51_09390 [Clavibacter michiganensis subsp. tessellarius]
MHHAGLVSWPLEFSRIEYFAVLFKEYIGALRPQLRSGVDEQSGDPFGALCVFEPQGYPFLDQ